MGYTYLRIGLLSPSDTGNQKPPIFADKSKPFLRELCYRTTSTSLNKVFFEVRELKKRMINRLKQQEQQASLVVQEPLRINNKDGPIAQLRDIQCKPNVSRRTKTNGKLVAHENGFRFTTVNPLPFITFRAHAHLVIHLVTLL